ncbi:MAG: MogA/MoaB family molybdenum cofactor biosynthesis protein [Acidimicrobiia bacterium]|nr:MogA/MoaB family molybdenum cofactor biosynthesis protein [Acidimicrobiia bacterium]
MREYRAAAVTVSNSASAGTADDTSGDVLVERLTALGFNVTERRCVPDGVDSVAGVLTELVTSVDLIVTSGGTGVSPTDRTPEGTRRVIDFEVPGIPEALRAATFGVIPFGKLSRGVAGIARQCLIINLPGSPRAVSEGFDDVLDEILAHSVQIANGDFGRHDEERPTLA